MGKRETFFEATGILFCFLFFIAIVVGLAFTVEYFQDLEDKIEIIMQRTAPQIQYEFLLNPNIEFVDPTAEFNLL